MTQRFIQPFHFKDGEAKIQKAGDFPRSQSQAVVERGLRSWSNIHSSNKHSSDWEGNILLLAKGSQIPSVPYHLKSAYSFQRIFTHIILFEPVSRQSRYYLGEVKCLKYHSQYEPSTQQVTWRALEHRSL